MAVREIPAEPEAFLNRLGVPFDVVRQILGRASIAPTQAYLSVTSVQEEEEASKRVELHEARFREI